MREDTSGRNEKKSGRKEVGVKIQAGIKRNQTGVQKKLRLRLKKKYLATLTGRHCSSDEGSCIRGGYYPASAPANNR